jgi:hypothetical protein
MIQRTSKLQQYPKPLRISPKISWRQKSMRQRSDYPTFSDAEIQRRHDAVYRLMAGEGVDALLFYGSGRYASDNVG